MEQNTNETVTISLKTYIQMQERIKTLEKENQEKTIYKTYLPEIYGQIILMLLLSAFVLWV